jgi:hypothetical protein
MWLILHRILKKSIYGGGIEGTGEHRSKSPRVNSRGVMDSGAFENIKSEKNLIF